MERTSRAGCHAQNLFSGLWGVSSGGPPRPLGVLWGSLSRGSRKSMVSCYSSPAHYD